MKNVKRKVLDDLKDYFDDLSNSEKEEVELEVIKYLCDNDRSPIDIKPVLPNSLYNYLDNKLHIVIEKEQEIREEFFSQYFPDASNSELFEILNRYKGIFFMRKRRLQLLGGKTSEVEKDTHLQVKEAVKM